MFSAFVDEETECVVPFSANSVIGIAIFKYTVVGKYTVIDLTLYRF